MRRAPDDPDGYAEFARLADEVGLRAGSPAGQAARYAAFGLLDEARATYAQFARALGPERTYAELSRRAARLAAETGAAEEARRLEAEATAVLSPHHAVGAVLGRVVELTGYDVAPTPARLGQMFEVTLHWRLLAQAEKSLMVYVHLRGDQGQRARVGDDHPLPPRAPGLGDGPQSVSERRQLMIPAGTEPGRYRLVAGVWDPASGRRLRHWWHGLVPTLETTIELGTVDIVPAR